MALWILALPNLLFQSAFAQTTYPQSPPPAVPANPGYPPAGTYPQQQPAYPQQQPAYPQQQPTYPQQQPAYPQQQPAYPQTQYPQQSPYPPQTYPQASPYPQPGYPAQAVPQDAHPIRQLFAGTIAILLNATGAGAASGIAGIAQNIIGRISAWFSRKTSALQPSQPYAVQQPYPSPYGTATSPYPAPAQAYTPTQAYPPTAPYPSPQGYASNQAPVYPAATQPYPTSPATAYPAPSQVPAYPSTSQPPNPAAGYPPTSAYQSTSPYPTAPGYGTGGAFPQPQTPGSVPSAYGNAAYPPTQVYDAYTGQPTSAVGTPYQMVASRGLEPKLYAGVAYEIQAVSPDGSKTVVDPATYVFHTGDRFVVVYRPSMPGRMEIYNINPAGQRSRIDSTTMAAGQLAVLGPYEFSNLTGDESLRLVLSPCSTPQLLVATRDIVNVSASASSSNTVQLGACDDLGTRSADVKTRDIKKVAVDDGTAFALDQVSSQELSAGHVIPREVNILFRHR